MRFRTILVDGLIALVPTVGLIALVVQVFPPTEPAMDMGAGGGDSMPGMESHGDMQPVVV